MNLSELYPSVGNMIYEGKAKKIYAVQDDPELLLHDFKNSLTAFNGVKKGEFANKGALNTKISTLVFGYLKQKGIDSHWVKTIGDSCLLTRKLKMIPLEVVVRNRVAGSLAKKLGIEEGQILFRPLVEFYLKNDALGDPFVSDEQAVVIGYSNEREVLELKSAALKVNAALKDFFSGVDLELVDFKLEYGRNKDGLLLLGDEVTPDTCRLWDIKTGERMDKDRFRRDLGQVQETYEEVYRRLLAKWGNT